MNFGLNIPPLLANVATLPCETLMSKNSHNLNMYSKKKLHPKMGTNNIDGHITL